MGGDPRCNSFAGQVGKVIETQKLILDAVDKYGKPHSKMRRLNIKIGWR